jgi:hypothetical protein
MASLPGRPTTRSIFTEYGSFVVALGGSPAANARAQRDANDRLLAFLRAVAR